MSTASQGQSAGVGHLVSVNLTFTTLGLDGSYPLTPRLLRPLWCGWEEMQVLGFRSKQIYSYQSSPLPKPSWEKSDYQQVPLRFAPDPCLVRRLEVVSLPAPAKPISTRARRFLPSLFSFSQAHVQVT